MRRTTVVSATALAAALISAPTLGVAAPKAPPKASPDGSVMPRTRAPAVISLPKRNGPRQQLAPTHSWTATALAAAFTDSRRRVPRTQVPAAFGHTLRPGEKFRFDISFAGNPAGLAEAEVVRGEPDPRGAPPQGAPTLKILGHARTSGVVSLLATATDDITSVVDATTGAAVSSTNVLRYDGFAPKYKHRVTEHSYEGRGQVRIVDTKDEKVKKRLKVVPVDTFDPMSAMAWVRSLDFEQKNKTFKAHVVDGLTLMRIEITPNGPGRPSELPSIATALELPADGIIELGGKLTRVDEYDQPIAGKKAFKLRAWISRDARRIPLVMESDMWVGAIRLELAAYDPPPGSD